MVTQADVGKWCQYVVDDVLGGEGCLLSVEAGWATLRDENKDGFFLGTDEFPAALVEVAP